MSSTNKRFRNKPRPKIANPQLTKAVQVMADAMTHKERAVAIAQKAQAAAFVAKEEAAKAVLKQVEQEAIARYWTQEEQHAAHVLNSAKEDYARLVHQAQKGE